MSRFSVEDLITAFKEMTLSELSEFTKRFREVFGVTADFPPAVQMPVPVTVEEEPQEPDRVSVILEGAGSKKIEVIKEVRALTRLGLKEAKDAVSAPPFTVAEDIDKEEALLIKAKLEAAGAVVSVK